MSWTPRTVCEQPERYVSSLAIYPNDPQALLAGGGSEWGHFANTLGWLARSEDGGETWEELAVGHVISEVTSIVVDPTMTDTLYIGACTIHPYWNFGSQSGVYKSTDGGTTWSPANDGLTYRCVRDLVMHPQDPELLLAAVNDPAPGAVGLFRSTDGGASWTPSDSGLDTGQVLELAIDPLVPSGIYAATWQGLFRSRDYGQSWRRVAGPLGYVPAFSVATAADQGRTLIYVGTVGGSMEAGPSRWVRRDAAGAVEAGVYRQTVVHRQGGAGVYLPLVMR